MTSHMNQLADLKSREDSFSADPADQKQEPKFPPRSLVKKLTLLNRLVRTSYFQFLVGNLNWRNVGRPQKPESGKTYVRTQQSLLELLVDLFVFVCMLFAAPFFAFNSFLSRRLANSYWPQFAFGACCGLLVMFLAYQLAKSLLP